MESASTRKNLALCTRAALAPLLAATGVLVAAASVFACGCASGTRTGAEDPASASASRHLGARPSVERPSEERVEPSAERPSEAAQPSAERVLEVTPTVLASIPGGSEHDSLIGVDLRSSRAALWRYSVDGSSGERTSLLIVDVPSASVLEHYSTEYVGGGDGRVPRCAGSPQSPLFGSLDVEAPYFGCLTGSARGDLLLYGRIARDFAPSLNLTGVRASPNGRFALVFATRRIFHVDLARQSAAVIGVPDGSTPSGPPAISPDSSRIAYPAIAGSEYRLYVQPSGGDPSAQSVWTSSSPLALIGWADPQTVYVGEARPEGVRCLHSITVADGASTHRELHCARDAAVSHCELAGASVVCLRGRALVAFDGHSGRTHERRLDEPFPASIIALRGARAVSYWRGDEGSPGYRARITDTPTGAVTVLHGSGGTLRDCRRHARENRDALVCLRGAELVEVPLPQP